MPSAPPAHWVQLLALLGIGVLCVAFSGLAVSTITEALGAAPDSPAMQRFSQGLFMVGGFLAAPLIWSHAVRVPLEPGLRVPIPMPSLLGGALLTWGFCLGPVAYVGHLNALIELPDWAMRLETLAMELLQRMLDTDSGLALAANLLVVALLPAICEEVFFRVGLQRLLQRWSGSRHAAVWIAAMVFSMIHFQFQGFAPRLMLGALLGYLYVYSGSIWPAVLVHFVNNTLSVLLIFFVGFEAFAEDWWFASVASRWYVPVVMLALLAGAVLSLRRYAARCKRYALPVAAGE